MHCLEDVALIAAPSFRSRAYLQRLMQIDIKIGRVLHFPGDEAEWDGDTEFAVDIAADSGTVRFRPGETVRETARSCDLRVDELPNRDINSESIIDFLERQPESVCIYSGFGGVILRPPVLARSGKRFLHVHGGWAPEYRGSTAFYYSIIRERMLGTTAMWLDEGIDTGPVLKRMKYPCIDGLEVDRVLDAMVRAHTLGEVVKERVASGQFSAGRSIGGPGVTYHVIHPVLKHFALRRCGLVDRDTA